MAKTTQSMKHFILGSTLVLLLAVIVPTLAEFGNQGMRGASDDPFKAVFRGVTPNNISQKYEEYQRTCENLPIDCPEIDDAVSRIEECEVKIEELDEKLSAVRADDRTLTKNLKNEKKALTDECKQVSKTAVASFKTMLGEASKLFKVFYERQMEDQRREMNQELYEMMEQQSHETFYPAKGLSPMKAPAK